MRVRWLEGYFGTVAYQFQQMYSALPKDPRALAYLLMRAYAHAGLRWN